LSAWTRIQNSPRCRRPELMDGPDLPADEHALALRGLARINSISRVAAVYWREIRGLAYLHRARALRVLDVASGGGDVAIALAWRAICSGFDVRVEGCDVSPQANQIAAARAQKRGVVVEFFTLNAIQDEFPSGFDVLTSSLFLHHLAENEVVAVLGKMAKAAGTRVLIDDLLRGPIEYAMAWAGCRLLTRSPIVHHDGPASVRAGFTIPEMRELAAQAGLVGITLKRHWPGRFLLSWSRP
jgi:2-polyprenyl-3-methyl-5-hydroxy-6-metoxy-1,4-benzoquinol methylase